MVPLVYKVDAFVGEGCAGNTAGVCLLESPLPESQMQCMAAKLGFAETAFVFPGDGNTAIRWFTPALEVDLCGHATLAAAWVLARELGEQGPWVFQSRSGPLGVKLDGESVVLDFPVQALEPRPVPGAIRSGLNGIDIKECFKARVPSGNWLLRLEDENTVRTLDVDLSALAKLDKGGVIVTARGERCDFVSRYFAPNYGIDEDAVTGSAHCALTPFWAERLHKKRFRARQLSERGGELFCEINGDRVAIGGCARLRGVINLNDR